MARITATQRIAISGTSAPSTALTPGTTYAITADADCYIRQGASNVVATTNAAGSFFLAKGVIIDNIRATDASDSFIAVIGTTGALYIGTLEGV